MGFELMTSSLPRMRSTPELHRLCNRAGAENEVRTRDPQLGRLMLYQLSYFRVLVGGGGLEPPNPEGADLQSAAIATMRTSHFVQYCSFRNVGADRGIRTHDPEITNHVLWPAELYRLVFTSFPKGIAKILINSETTKLFQINFLLCARFRGKCRPCQFRRRPAARPAGPGR